MPSKLPKIQEPQPPPSVSIQLGWLGLNGVGLPGIIGLIVLVIILLIAIHLMRGELPTIAQAVIDLWHLVRPGSSA